jgi:NAD(P)-dependent dehydrogenase (short-subunit alcohol dehydrogenase family)
MKDSPAIPSSVRALFDLTGQVAIITGGAGLLGRQHASAIAEAGGHAVLVDLAEEAAVRSTEEITRQFGVEAVGIRADVTVKSDVEAMVRAVVEKFGRIDILINNAALTAKGGSARAREYFAPFEEYPLDLWEQALRVNLTGTFLCSQAVGRVMVRQRRGVVLNIASDVGTISPDHRVYEGVVNPYTKEPFNTPIGYATTKAGIINLTRYLATYWADKGIRVNCLSPGGVADAHEPQFVKNVSSRVPLGRMARPDEYKGTVLFLVSEASSYMTGGNLIVDGGRTAW